jgi:hypothetical protein
LLAEMLSHDFVDALDRLAAKHLPAE